MSADRTFDLDLLLREEAWLRAFVRRLVDRDDVDDLVQQTWLAALQRPRDGERALRVALPAR